MRRAAARDRFSWPREKQDGCPAQLARSIGALGEITTQVSAIPRRVREPAQRHPRPTLSPPASAAARTATTTPETVTTLAARNRYHHHAARTRYHHHAARTRDHHR